MSNGRQVPFSPQNTVAAVARQVAMVIDLNKCIGCQTCTVSCKTQWTNRNGREYMYWNNVETKPYGSYPLAYDLKLLDMLNGQQWNGNKYEDLVERLKQQGACPERSEREA